MSAHPWGAAPPHAPLQAGGCSAGCVRSAGCYHPHPRRGRQRQQPRLHQRGHQRAQRVRAGHAQLLGGRRRAAPGPAASRGSRLWRRPACRGAGWCAAGRTAGWCMHGGVALLLGGRCERACRRGVAGASGACPICMRRCLCPAGTLLRLMACNELDANMLGIAVVRKDAPWPDSSRTQSNAPGKATDAHAPAGAHWASRRRATAADRMH